MELLASYPPTVRLRNLIDTSWNVLFSKVISGRLIINKESSLQLHLAKTLSDLGNVYCLLPGETFSIELESQYNNKNIDITCRLGETIAAIELKCFRKASNRAKDIDCYDVLKDLERLQSYEEHSLKTFICLTDNKYYRDTVQKGKGKSVSINHGTIYRANQPIIPGWAKQWKVKRDNPIVLKNDFTCHWETVDSWHYLKWHNAEL